MEKYIATYAYEIFGDYSSTAFIVEASMDNVARVLAENCCAADKIKYPKMNFLGPVNIYKLRNTETIS